MVPAMALTAALLAACGASSPSGRSPTPPPPASPTAPSSADGRSVIDAFIALTHAPDRSMHLELTGLVGFGELEFTLLNVYDVQGPDFYGTTTIENPMFGTVPTGYALIDGKAYKGDSSAGRTSLAWGIAEAPTQDPDPFVGLTAADVEYVDQHLRIKDPVAAFERAWAGANNDAFTRLEVSTSSFDVDLDQTGKPVGAALKIEGTVTGNAGGPISVALTYTFADWGKDFAITAPATPAFASPGPPGSVFTGYNRYNEPVVFRDTAGHQLAVAACDQASTDVFKASEVQVVFASDGAYVGGFGDASQTATFSYAFVGSGRTAASSAPFLAADIPPCAGR